jgi:hypothetical protein
MTDIEFIKKSSKITVINACEICKVNYSNVWSGRASKRNIKKVRVYIEKQLKDLIRDGKSEDNSLQS